MKSVFLLIFACLTFQTLFNIGWGLGCLMGGKLTLFFRHAGHSGWEGEGKGGDTELET